MSFCKFSTGYLTNRFTSIDNGFITSYMPFAKEDYTKVYLYGLFLCSNMINTNLENFANDLDLPIDTVNDAVKYWEEQGLIAIASRTPLEVIYLPIKGEPIKKYKPEKYEDFNYQLQSLYPDREITQGEYLKYYEFIDDTKISADALIMIAKYCIDLKGLKVRYPYILTVAKDWVGDGIKNCDKVEDRIKEYELNNDTMRKIAKAIGKKSSIEMEDKQLYTKWTKSWGYDLESILYAGSLQKNRGGFERLDRTLDNFYKLGIFAIDRMKEYQTNRNKLYELTRKINKILGLYYADLDYIVETYVSRWLGMGYEEDGILLIADISRKSGFNNYEYMNKKVALFYKNGRITKHAISEWLASLIETDNRIKDIITALGSSRLPNNSDRDYYNTWTDRWGYTHDVIEYVAGVCSTKSQSMAYLNNTLGRYYEDGIFTIAEIQARGKMDKYDQTKDYYNVDREFTAEELQGLFTSVDDIDKLEI